MTSENINKAPVTMTFTMLSDRGLSIFKKWLSALDINFISKNNEISITCDRDMSYAVLGKSQRINDKFPAIGEWLDDNVNKIKISNNDIKQNNPMAAELHSGKYKSSMTPKKDVKMNKQDNWSRKAKHKGNKSELYEQFVLYNNSICPVIKQDVHNNITVILFNGKKTVVESTSIKLRTHKEILNETGLSRLSELAGIINEDEMPAQLPEPVKVPSDNVVAHSNVPPMDRKDDLEDLSSNSELSDDFKQAMVHLDEVYLLATKLRLEEYKLFVHRMQGFHKRVEKLGREYLR